MVTQFSLYRVFSYPPATGLVWIIFLTFFGSQSFAQVNPGTVSFSAGTSDVSGYSRMDIVWNGYTMPLNDPAVNYSLNVSVTTTASSNRCIDETLTEASEHASFGASGTLNATSTSVTFTASNIDALNLNSLSQPIILYSIYYVGTPGGTVTFSWSGSPAPVVARITAPTQNWYLSLGSSTSPSFNSRTISGAIYKAPITQSNCSGGSNAAVTQVSVDKTINTTCSPVLTNTTITNQNDGNI